MARTSLALALVVTGLLSAAPAATAPDRILEQCPSTPGLCVLAGENGAATALALAGKTKLKFLVQVASAEDMARACGQARAAGMLGRRIFVAQEAKSIPLANDMADMVVLPAGSPIGRKEVLRVLRPGGKGVLGRQTLVKGIPKGMDDWGHHYHGPDNNPQSRDKRARAPFLTQFVVAPRYAPCPQIAVASGGRVFLALGHVAWHKREEPWLNTLVAFNGYNGTMLWKKPLPSGIMVDRSTMIATPDVLYLADHTSCKLIDPDTGKITGEIQVPEDLTGGTFWKWMALQDGVLYALVGAGEKPDNVAKWRALAQHGWPWGGISKGYNAGQYPWGFANTLLAIDPKTKKVLWYHREKTPIDSRSLCMKAGKIFFCHFGKYLACLSAKTGKPIWKKTVEKDAGVFEAIGRYRPGHGYIGGWKSTVYLKCTEKNLYFLGPQVHHLTVLSAEDGRVRWRYPGKDLHIVIRDDAVYCTGPQNTPKGQAPDTRKLDPLSGKVLASYAVNRRACTRSTGSVDGIYFRAPGGSVRLDLATGKSQWISPMRPSCLVGVMIAHGHMYWVPWTCDCNLQMFGMISCGPAGDYKFGAKAVESERLQAAGVASRDLPFAAKRDWPTYRGNNARTGVWGGEIPGKVRKLWHYKPAHTFQATAPVAAGGLVLLGGSDGMVRALAATNGNVKWQACTGGAVRFPPAIAGGRAFVGSGDGWAYAFEANSGRRLWRFRAAPQERRITVFGQLQSTWPVAAGVLVEDGTAYLAAGMNNFDGTHVYALDAATGRIKWQNNTSGHLDKFSRRGVGVQGDMLLHEGKLFLAGGNAASPGVFEAATGKCLTPAPTQWGSHAPRGRELQLRGSGVSVTGQPFYQAPHSPVFDRSVQWLPAVVQAAGASSQFVRATDSGQWALVARDSKTNQRLWAQPLPSTPVRWGLALDASGRIFVTLHNGQVLCFGA